MCKHVFKWGKHGTVCIRCGQMNVLTTLPDNQFPDYPVGVSTKAVSRDTKVMSVVMARAGVSRVIIQDSQDEYIQRVIFLSSHSVTIKAGTRRALMVISVFDTTPNLSDNLKYHFLKVFRVSGRQINNIYKIIKRIECQA